MQELDPDKLGKGRNTSSTPAPAAAPAASAAPAPAKKEAAKPAAAEPKKDTIVVDKPVTKEDVEKLGKELDKLNEAEAKQAPTDNNTAAN